MWNDKELAKHEDENLTYTIFEASDTNTIRYTAKNNLDSFRIKLDSGEEVIFANCGKGKPGVRGIPKSHTYELGEVKLADVSKGIGH